MMTIKLGARRSDLARIQAKIVIDLIMAIKPECEMQYVPLTSVGDKDRRSGFQDIGGIGAFTKESEEALLEKRIDIVVHSLKDLPTRLPDQLLLAAVPKREDPRDALCGLSLFDLGAGTRIGTGSVRRRAQLLAICPEITIKPIRGNVPPRLRKAKNKEGIDGTVLAVAGLSRLGILAEATEILDPAIFPYAVGQGALGIEARKCDEGLLDLLSRIEDRSSRHEVEAERAFMRKLEAGCSLPVGISTKWDGDDLILYGQVTKPDGSQRLVNQVRGTRMQAATLGEELGHLLLADGAEKILAACR